VTYVVYVHNSGHPALYDTATVYVTVRDVNDNSPVFASSSDGWTLDVPENANMAAIHTVEASDADDGDNARISYFISGIFVYLLRWQNCVRMCTGGNIAYLCVQTVTLCTCLYRR